VTRRMLVTNLLENSLQMSSSPFCASYSRESNGRGRVATSWYGERDRLSTPPAREILLSAFARPRLPCTTFDHTSSASEDDSSERRLPPCGSSSFMLGEHKGIC
jgi:hypothetical protein